MALTFESIGTRVSRALQDPDNIRWTKTEIIDWIYEAQQEIARISPDCYVKTVTVSVTANSAKQDLAAQIAALGSSYPLPSRLIDIPRSVTQAKAIRQTERRFLDAEQPGWSISSGAGGTGSPSNGLPTHFCYDQRSPLFYWLYPVPTTGQQIEVVYAAIPTASWNQSAYGTLATVISDQFGAAIVDYVLYRAYSKDADYAANDNRAQWHKKAFYEALNLNQTADQAAEPSGKRPT